MALTYTPETDSSQTLIDFEAVTVDGRKWSSASVRQAPAKVFVFMCNHCPYVKAIENRLIRLAKELQEINVPFIGICSNDPTDYPEDSPAELLKTWESKNYGFPYLIDGDQSIAKSLGAVCTPDFFVYDGTNKLAYRGRLDDSWKDESKVTREELKGAVQAIVNKLSPPQEQSPSMGCSIKWKDL